MEPQKNKHSVLKIVLITLGVVVALVIIVVGLGVFLAYRSSQAFNTNDKPVIMAEADQFISDINQGKVNDAAALGDPQDMSAADLTQNLTQLQQVYAGYERQDSNFLNENIISTGGGMTVTYNTTAYFSDNTQGTLGVTAAQENGQWKLLGVHLTASPAHINGK